MAYNTSNITILARSVDTNGKPVNDGVYSVQVKCKEADMFTALAKVRADAQTTVQASKGKGLVIHVETFKDGNRVGVIKLEKDVMVG